VVKRTLFMGLLALLAASSAWSQPPLAERIAQIYDDQLGDLFV